MQFLDVKTDYAFKKVFGSEDSKDILINFLNSIIYLDTPSQIKDLNIVDPYNIPMLKGMKDNYVDVKAILDDDTTVIIEMQVLNLKGFEKRVLYSAAKNYSVQLKKGEAYNLLNPVIALTITDFVMFKDTKKIITNFKLLEKEEFIDYGGDIELIFIELPKFKKTFEELETIQDKWIYFIKNAGKLDFKPNNMDKELDRAFDIINEANLSEYELEQQWKRRDFIMVMKAREEEFTEKGILEGFEKGMKDGLEKGMEKGLEKGIEQGIEKGIEQGIFQGKLAVAVSAYKNGVPTYTISEIVGIEEEKLMELLKIELDKEL